MKSQVSFFDHHISIDRCTWSLINHVWGSAWEQISARSDWWFWCRWSVQLTNRFTVFGGSISEEECFQHTCQKAERSKWWKKIWVSGLRGPAYQALNRRSNWPYVQNLMACNHNKQGKITLKNHIASILKESKRMEQTLTFSFLTMVVHPLAIVIMGVFEW